jgi:hypothetical protein
MMPICIVDKSVHEPVEIDAALTWPRPVRRFQT